MNFVMNHALGAGLITGPVNQHPVCYHCSTAPNWKRNWVLCQRGSWDRDRERGGVLIGNWLMILNETCAMVGTSASYISRSTNALSWFKAVHWEMVTIPTVRPVRKSWSSSTVIRSFRATSSTTSRQTRSSSIWWELQSLIQYSHHYSTGGIRSMSIPRLLIQLV